MSGILVVDVTDGLTVTLSDGQVARIGSLVKGNIHNGIHTHYKGPLSWVIKKICVEEEGSVYINGHHNTRGHFPSMGVHQLVLVNY